MIKAVLIDIDNTILDFDQCVKDAMSEGFRKFELPPYKGYMFDAFTIVNNQLWLDYEAGKIDFEGILRDRWNRIFEFLNIAFDGQRFEDYFVEYIFNSHIAVEGAKEMLDYLGDKYLVCAASNGPEGQQRNRLEKAGLLKYFTLLFISERMGAVKPQKAFFDLVKKELNDICTNKIFPDEIMIIGDSLTSDIAGGHCNGLKTCWYVSGDRELDSNIKPDFIIRNLLEVKDIL